MFWTLELASYLEDAPWPATKDELIDCANYCVTLFSDLSRYVTMQNLFHDGGFSFTGVSEAVVKSMEAANNE